MQKFQKILFCLFLLFFFFVLGYTRGFQGVLVALRSGLTPGSIQGNKYGARDWTGISSALVKTLGAVPSLFPQTELLYHKFSCCSFSSPVRIFTVDAIRRMAVIKL